MHGDPIQGRIKSVQRLATFDAANTGGITMSAAQSDPDVQPDAQPDGAPDIVGTPKPPVPTPDPWDE